MPARPIRVLIVDDSALVRRILTDSLAHDPEIEVVGVASDPYMARDKILSLNPDVLTLDIEMPRMDGLSFLRLIMKHRPMPVIIISSLTAAGSSKAVEALHSGAVDVMAKPAGSYSAHADGHELASKIKAAFHARVGGSSPTSNLQRTGDTALVHRPPAPPSLYNNFTKRIAPSSRSFSPEQVILIGASTGGTEALKTILTGLSSSVPGICIVQHIPAYFSRAFADRLNALCQMEVREAQRGDIVRPGLALIAPGGFHMLLRRGASGYSIELSEGPKVHHQRPAVDVLFDSACKIGAAASSLALLLTGMGADGAEGLLHLKEAGASTVAQDEESCVVFGMPREAIKRGAAQRVLPLDQMAGFIESYAGSVALRA
ncbi:MAG TPA: chemotaxis response regulator protein-glutamate methylesterase [Methylomirabilota bacterium]|nr:chemotaxis response regulator protein-glutamate methylesterase [Methylomirabilota bacterium]